MRRLAAVAAGLLFLGPTRGAAQGYRLRLDTRAQAVSYRGLTPDSVPVSEVVVGPTGGFVTTSGIAVRCTGGTFCFYFRPGPELQGVPVSATASLVLWGLGLPGLTLHATGRLVADLGEADAWPGADPTGQLLEGYLEYGRDWLTARGGRLLAISRLEPIGFDGAWLRVRWNDYDLEATGFGGWGLGQAAVVPITSPVLNPLDEWRPRERQLVAGAELAWLPGPIDVRAEYRREVEQETGDYVSERTALSLGVHPWRFLRATGGLDYNLAEGHIGNADLGVTYLHPRLTVTAGGRRHRPYFSLWTLWGAFSPAPYNAVHGSAQVQLTDWLAVHGRGERYWYEDAEVSTPLVDVEDRGWRLSLGATAALHPKWSVDGAYLADFGPGASSRYVDAMVTFQPTAGLALSAYGGTLERPLELRFYDAETAWIGGRGDWRVDDHWRIWADAAWFAEDRNRPDAAATAFDQLRLRGGATLVFGSSADRSPLPPARRRRP